MRILQITKKFPWPVKDGEVIGIINLTLGFAAAGHQVTTLSLNTRKHYFNPDDLPQHVKNAAQFRAVDIDTSVKPLPALLNLFSGRSYNIERFRSVAFEKLIAETLSSHLFDFVLLEGVYLMQYLGVIRNHFKGTVVFRPQNVEYIIWERLRQHETNPLKKWYLGVLAKRMKAFELQHLNSADVMITVSETDLQLFRNLGCRLPSCSIPTGYMFDELPPIDENEEQAVGFIGGLDWMPNREGVEWFLTRVWPLVLQEVPDAKFYLAGRNFPAELMRTQQPGVVPLGEVEDARSFIRSKSISICPLFAGSGMRVKIVEAMALGRAIVSTTVGAESLEYTAGKDLLIADDEHAFAAAIVLLLQNKNERMQLGINGQQLVLNVYDNRKICRRIVEFVNQFRTDGHC